jgi:hypothetical protein
LLNLRLFHWNFLTIEHDVKAMDYQFDKDEEDADDDAI